MSRIASFRRGDRWMRTGETLALSEEEARVLGERIADGIAGDLGLDDGRTASLRALFQTEIYRGFERAHASEGPLGQRLDREWPGLLDRVLAGSREFLTEEQVTRLGDALRARFGGGR